MTCIVIRLYGTIGSIAKLVETESANGKIYMPFDDKCVFSCLKYERINEK